MKKRWISLLLALVMVLSLFPATALAADGEPDVNPATGREAGPAGSQKVAMMLYGKAITDAVMQSRYDFEDFWAAVKGEAQGILANEKLPEAEVYLVNDQNQEYRLTPSTGEGASLINSLGLHCSGLLGWLEYVLDWLTDLYNWILSDVPTFGQLYKIYRADNVPEGDYTLEVRGVDRAGYTFRQPNNGTVRVHVGTESMNYVGYEESVGKHTFDIAGLELATIDFTMPGVFLTTVDPGLSFTSADLGGHALPGAEFVMINRDETVNILNAAFALGKDTFTNAIKLIGTEGFTWDELSLLRNQLVKLDTETLQLSLNEDNAYKLLKTYWALVSAAAKDPLLTFMNKDTNIRVPAILKATADENGLVRFTEKSNVTLTWSIEILLEMGNIALQSEITDDLINSIEYPDEQTESMVKTIFWIAQSVMEKGAEYWDEHSESIKEAINGWIYPMMQNDNLKDGAIWLLKFFKGEDFVNEHADVLQWLPDHAFLTAKMPAGSYILFEGAVPKGYLRSPLCYTIHLEWRTENLRPCDWYYGSIANLGVILPYFAEDYYTFLRNSNAAAMADELIGKFTGNPGTMVQDLFSGREDMTALSIAFGANLIYNHLGGKLVYDSELSLAQDLTKYLYTYGRTTQNLLMFAAKVAQESKNVITCEVNYQWKFYTATTSIRTNLALQVQSVIRGIADSVDTSGSSVISSVAKDVLNDMADNIDTTNRIIEETTAMQEQVKETVTSVVSKVVSSVANAAASFGKWLIKMGSKP